MINFFKNYIKLIGEAKGSDKLLAFFLGWFPLLFFIDEDLDNSDKDMNE